MSLTAKEVAEILRLLEESRFDELQLEMNGVKIQLRRGQEGTASSQAAERTPLERAPVAAMPATKPPRPAPAGAVAVPAPLLGIFYRAPRPGEPPFIEVGSKVSPDSVIGIIEVMKLMNTVRAGVQGEVLRIDAVNGELVEFGEALLFVKG